MEQFYDIFFFLTEKVQFYTKRLDFILNRILSIRVTLKNKK